MSKGEDPIQRSRECPDAGGRGDLRHPRGALLDGLDDPRQDRDVPAFLGERGVSLLGDGGGGVCEVAYSSPRRAAAGPRPACSRNWLRWRG
jgi:hypothetical protein